MDKNALKELIKKLVREKVGTMNIPREEPVKYTDKFLSFEEVLTELLTDQYPLFIQDVGWVAPKPTTFRVEFKNGQSTYLTKTEKGWNCEVEGKKYDLEGLQGMQRATEAIARILRYGTAKPAGEESIETETPIESPASEEKPEETPPTETPEETPAETPPAEA